ncbi:MAG: hypothetical protein WAT39_05080, partial [Planctomycetota bacterium]
MRLDVRELTWDDPAVLARARADGAHGVYVWNALAAHEGEGFVVRADGRDALQVWIGPRGNLVVSGTVDPPAALAARVADTIVARPCPWRIAMGPPAVLAELRARLRA